MAEQGHRTSIRYIMACMALILYILLVMLPLLVQPQLVMGAALGGLEETSYMRPWCYRWECCMENWIPGNTAVLATSLQQQLYGQHLVQNTVSAAIRGHLYNPNPSRPLVLSFHGPPATGKNYVSKIIAESLYTKGLDSKYAHLWISTFHFPHKSDIKEYKKTLKDLITSNVAKCQRQLFIFDEVDMMPPGLLDTLRPYLDDLERIEGVDYRRSIFIFLSNIASYAINNYTMHHYLDGYSREDIKLKDMEGIIMKEAFNEKDTGLRHSRLLDSFLISHFIPFLPLEPRHVRQCINRQLVAKCFTPDKSITDAVIDELQFYGPGDTDLFAVKGCRSIAEKLNLVTKLHGYTENCKEGKAEL